MRDFCCSLKKTRQQSHISLLRCAGAPLGAILNFLLQLGFREVGSAFRVDSLSAVERTIAADVAQLGLLMPFMCAPSSALQCKILAICCTHAVSRLASQ